MKKLALIFAFVIISCSDSDKFNSYYNYKIRIDSISYTSYLYGNFSLDSANYSVPISLNEFSDCCVRDYYWVINGVVDSSRHPTLSYGSHSVELFLIDDFGDTISASKNICLNEPLKIALLSPIDNYRSSRTESLEYQYKFSGWNCRENIRDTVIIERKANQCFSWKVMVFTEKDTAYSELRNVCLED